MSQLPRFDIRHKGAYSWMVPVEDGYWTPWHLTAWVSFLKCEPAPEEVVLVTSEEWEHPKVLRYHSIGQGRHRLYELDESRFYYYPERMHWMPIPHSSRNK